MHKVFLPRTLHALWQMMKEEPGALLYAGGTDLLVKLRGRTTPQPTLICLERIRELNEVREKENHFVIGATAAHASLLENDALQKNFPVLTAALRVLGSPPIRNMGTIGGNICTASPAADTLPPLYVLDAELELLSETGVRRMPVSDFIMGPGKTKLQANEILSGICLKKPHSRAIHHFEKVGQRNALAIAVVSLAALLETKDGAITRARLAWGSVGPSVATSADVERMLVGRPLSLETLLEAGKIAEQAVHPIDDIRGSAAYRRQVAGRLLRRLAEKTERPITP